MKNKNKFQLLIISFIIYYKFQLLSQCNSPSMFDKFLDKQLNKFFDAGL